jgi:hypothetical protein
MRRFTWRFVLALSNPVIAIALSAIGAEEYKTFLRELGHHDGPILYIPTPELITDCLNAPPFVLSNLLSNVRLWRLLWGNTWLYAYWFDNVSVSFFLMLFLFWWLVGWWIDVRGRPKERPVAKLALYSSVAGFLAVWLIWAGIELLRVDVPAGRVPGGPAIPISMIVWGVLLFSYFGSQFMRLRGSSFL